MLIHREHSRTDPQPATANAQAIDGDEHFIKMPFVAEYGPSGQNAFGGLLTKLQCPAPNRFIGSR